MFRWTTGDPNLCDELKFERQAEETYSGDESDLEERFRDDTIPKLHLQTLETMETGGSDDDDGKDSGMGLARDQEGGDIL